MKKVKKMSVFQEVKKSMHKSQNTKLFFVIRTKNIRFN